MSDRINVDVMRENKEEIKRYFSMVCDASGKVNFFRHKMYLKDKEPIALLCQKIVDDNNIRMAELKYLVVDKDLNDLHLYCETCGKRVKNLLADRRFCCQKCRGQSEEARDKAKETRRSEREKYGIIKKENADLEIDTEMKSLKANEQLLRQYMSEITDTYGTPNISTHHARIRHGDETAIKVSKILAEYDIKIVDLKAILDKNFEDIHFFCPTCGKRITDLRRKFCSVKCSANSKEVINRRHNTFSEKYGENTSRYNSVQDVVIPDFVYKEIELSNLRNYKEEIRTYIENLIDSTGIHNMSTHKKGLRSGNATSILVEAIIRKYGIKMSDVTRLVEKDFNLSEYNKNRKKNRIDTLTEAKIRSKTEKEEFNKKYSLSKNKPENIDSDMKSIKAQESTIRTYINSIIDSTGAPNVSTHRMNLSANKSDAILTYNVLREYGITLKELKYILDKNFTGISFYCKTCGKRLEDIRHEYCSKSCAYASNDRKEKYKKTCLERYGVENSTASHIIQERMKKTNLERRGVEYNFQAEDVKEKIRHTWEEKYGVDNPNKSDVVMEKMKNTNRERYGVDYTFQAEEVKKDIAEKVNTVRRKKKYPLLMEWLKRKNIELLSSYEEYLTEDTLHFKCLECGRNFDAKYSTYLQYRICCEYCYADKRSADEGEIFNYIRNLLPDDVEIIKNGRTVLNGQELDIYIPSKNFAIEYDGAYWHSSNMRNTDPLYHLNKTEMCANQSISLLHIFEHEWQEKKEIVKSVIKTRLKIIDNIIYARNCDMRRISDEEYMNFVELNHLQGYVPAQIKLGLFYNDELVCCAGIGKSRFKKGEIELIRFCTKLGTHVVGGLSKIMKNSGIPHLVSYVDRRYFTGAGYEKAGFTKIGETHPGYIYVKGNTVLTRYQCQKHMLPALLGCNFDENLTEAENMASAGYCQLYDCGMLKYEYTAE